MLDILIPWVSTRIRLATYPRLIPGYHHKTKGNQKRYILKVQKEWDTFPTVSDRNWWVCGSFRSPRVLLGYDASYWRGWFNIYIISTGLVYSVKEGFINRTWTHPETGVVHAFHCGHWGNWQFAVKGRDNTKREIKFDYGGYQEARGCKTGAEWYVENIVQCCWMHLENGFTMKRK